MNPSDPKLENIYSQLLAFKKLKVEQEEDTSLVDKLISQTKKAGNFNDENISYLSSSIEEAYILVKEIQSFVEEKGGSDPSENLSVRYNTQQHSYTLLRID